VGSCRLPVGGRPSAIRFDIAACRPCHNCRATGLPPYSKAPLRYQVYPRSDPDVSDAGFLIRPVQPEDRTAWLGLRRHLWPDGTEEQHAADIARFFDAPRRSVGMMPEQVFIAVTTGTTPDLVGFAELSRRAYAEGCETSPVGFLEGWYVVSSRRRQGIGRALVAAGEAWARALGCREFASDAVADNVLSASAHRALGFDEVEVIRCFRKDLTP